MRIVKGLEKLRLDVWRGEISGRVRGIRVR